MVALRAIQGTSDYFFPFLSVHFQLEPPFAYGADQDLH
jgi:hypothetical protein